MKKTPWFDGSVKPVRVGVYERTFGSGETHFSKWDGKRWNQFGNLLYASRQMNASGWQNLPWRGLTKPPKGTP